MVAHTRPELKLSDVEREMRSGWVRTTVTTLVGLIALATTTYTVVSKIAAAELIIKDSVARLERLEVRMLTTVSDRAFNRLNDRVVRLEETQLPASTERIELKTWFSNLNDSLAKIDRRLERLEAK